MKLLLSIAIVISAFLFVGCNQNNPPPSTNTQPPTQPITQEESILGTWNLVSIALLNQAPEPNTTVTLKFTNGSSGMFDYIYKLEIVMHGQPPIDGGWCICEPGKLQSTYIHGRIKTLNTTTLEIEQGGSGAVFTFQK